MHIKPPPARTTWFTGRAAPFTGRALRRSSGFTMLELVVTVTVVGVLTGLALPSIDVAGYRARSAVLETSTLLAAAQNRAVLGQHDVVVSFDTIAGTARIHLDANNDGQVQPEEHIRVVEISEGIRFSRGEAPARSLGPRGVTFTRVQDGRPSVTFHRSGSASQAGVIYLTPGSAGATSPDLKHVRAVEVERATGRATCFSLRAGTWEESC